MKVLNLASFGLMVSLAGIANAYGEAAILNASGGTANNAIAFSSSQIVVKPMSVTNGMLSTSAANQGSAIMMMFAKKGRYALELKVSAAGANANSAYINLTDSKTDAGALRLIDFASGQANAFQRLSGAYTLEADGWYFLHVKGAEANTGLISARLITLPAEAPVVVAPPVVVTPPVVTPPVVKPPVVTPPVVVNPPVDDREDALSANARELKLGEIVNAGGMGWGVQTPRIMFDNGDFHFKAKTGEFANFDPADGRKIRNEVAAMTRFDRGQLLTAEMNFTIKAPAIAHKDLQWFIPIQIHQADTRNAQGATIPASPMFAMDVQPAKSGTGYELQVQGETSTNMAGGFQAQRVFARVPFEVGKKHRLKIEVVDSHGYAGGMVRVTLDGVVICDKQNIATGWSYVDTDVLFGGKRQDNRSYLKIGIYAGNQFRPADVSLENIITDLSVSIR